MRAARSSRRTGRRDASRSLRRHDDGRAASSVRAVQPVQPVQMRVYGGGGGLVFCTYRIQDNEYEIYSVQGVRNGTDVDV